MAGHEADEAAKRTRQTVFESDLPFIHRYPSMDMRFFTTIAITVISKKSFNVIIVVMSLL